MSQHTPHRDVFDGAAGALQDEPVGDLGRCPAFRAADELERGTVHLVLLSVDHERHADPLPVGARTAGPLGWSRAAAGVT
jgi:hypothetical protein